MGKKKSAATPSFPVDDFFLIIGVSEPWSESRHQPAGMSARAIFLML
jgi:hypothetical protein